MNTPGSPITESVTLYLWISGVPVVVSALLLLVTGLVAVFSLQPARRDQARAIFNVLVSHRPSLRKRRASAPAVTESAVTGSALTEPAVAESGDIRP